MNGKMNRQIGVKINDGTFEKLCKAAKKTGLNVSTLARIGIIRVIQEWEATGSVTIKAPKGLIWPRKGGGEGPEWEEAHDVSIRPFMPSLDEKGPEWKGAQDIESPVDPSGKTEQKDEEAQNGYAD